MEIYTIDPNAQEEPEEPEEKEDGEEQNENEDEEKFVSKSYWFKGTCYPQRGTFKGTWGYTLEENLGDLEFKVETERKVDIVITMKDGGEKFEDEVTYNMRTLKFESNTDTDEKKLKGIFLTSIEHLDNC